MTTNDYIEITKYFKENNANEVTYDKSIFILHNYNNYF